MKLRICFDEKFPDSNNLNTDVSLNICPECTHKLNGMIKSAMEATEQKVIDAKISLGDNFNNLILENTMNEESNLDFNGFEEIKDTTIAPKEIVKNISCYKIDDPDLRKKIIDIITDDKLTNINKILKM